MAILLTHLLLDTVLPPTLPQSALQRLGLHI